MNYTCTHFSAPQIFLWGFSLFFGIDKLSLPIEKLSIMAKTKEIKVADLQFDDKNFNKHTEFGMSLIEKSLRKNGAGRSILIDKNNRIIGGNGVVENAGQIGMEDVIVVETDGTKLVAVKRTDIDLDSKQGREMALADNATAAADLAWDVDAIAEVESELDIDVSEWGVILDESEQYGDEFTLPNGNKEPFQQMTFTLADEQADVIKSALTDCKNLEEYKFVETMGNENTNGNALFFIVKQWADARK